MNLKHLRRSIIVLPVATISGAAQPVRAAPSPAFHGRLLIRYQPGHCFRAPCPRSSFSVEIAGKRIGLVKRIDVDGRTARQQRDFIQGFRWSAEPLAIEGDAWLKMSASRVTVRADRALEGEWKP